MLISCRIDSAHNLEVVRNIQKEIPDHSFDQIRGLWIKLEVCHMAVCIIMYPMLPTHQNGCDTTPSLLLHYLP